MIHKSEHHPYPGTAGRGSHEEPLAAGVVNLNFTLAHMEAQHSADKPD